MYTLQALLNGEHIPDQTTQPSTFMIRNIFFKQIFFSPKLDVFITVVGRIANNFGFEFQFEIIMKFVEEFTFEEAQNEHNQQQL